MSSADGRGGTPVHKVLNNNVVIQVDESGRERVLMGRGIGFQLKPADAVDPAKVEKTFILDEGEAGERELRLLGDVPYPVIEAVSRATDAAERSLGRALGRLRGRSDRSPAVRAGTAREGGAHPLDLHARAARALPRRVRRGNGDDRLDRRLARHRTAPEESVFQVTTSIDDDGIWNAFARNGLI